jgi:magnesium transporter
MIDHLQQLASTLEKIRAALSQGRFAQAVQLLLEQHPADRAEVFNLLDRPEQSNLMYHLDIPATADLLEELDDRNAVSAVETLPMDLLAGVLDEMEPDAAADLLGDLEPQQASKALAQMEDAEEVIPLLGYPDESAGGLMTTSYVALRRQTTIQQAIEFLRRISPEAEVPYDLYVIDRNRRLVGVLGLRELVVADPHETLENLMLQEVVRITTGTDQEVAARLMTRYDLAAIPVVDDQGRLIGVITYDDLVEVLDLEATEDIYRLANVADTDLQPDSRIREQLRGRLPWLYLSAGTALLAAWVISLFEAVIAQVAVLAVFQSVVAGLGGNAVSQNMAMIVRSIALGKITIRQVWSLLGRQLLVGMLQGLAVGSVVAAGVFLWRGNAYLSLVLGMALVGNMMIAGIFGTLVPLGLSAAGQDPALASSVLVTAATDSLGFLIFLGLASVFLGQILSF